MVLGGGPNIRVVVSADVRVTREDGGGWELDLSLIGRHDTGSQGTVALGELVCHKTGLTCTWRVLGIVPALAAAAQ